MIETATYSEGAVDVVDDHIIRLTGEVLELTAKFRSASIDKAGHHQPCLVGVGSEELKAVRR